MRRLMAGLVGTAITLFAHLVTAVRPIWDGIEPTTKQRVFFANHNSNADTVLIWTVLPPALRTRTRPVAAADYWLGSAIKQFIGQDVFNTVLIERRPEHRQQDPIEQMTEALNEGASLILFPEGTRNTTDETLLQFKPGLFHLAIAKPEVELVPVWIENLNSVMPKGEVVPIPLLCTVRFGAPVHLAPGEEKAAFLDRARTALLALSEAAA